MKKILILLIAIATVTITTVTFAKPRVWIFLSDGTQITVDATNFDSVSFVQPTVTDACGNTYPAIKIGEQYWMAENMRCNKYDTQSEAYKEGRYIIPTSGSIKYTPYYTEVSDTSKWDRDSKKIYGVNLKDEQVAKLGYLYNWAAAVGVGNGYNYGTQPFSGNRQGICPNGWHVPTMAEQRTLKDYIEKTDGKGLSSAGKHLKTTSGWYDEGKPQAYPQGLDTYGFAALPAGCAEGSSVGSVGSFTSFWTATPCNSSSYAHRNYLRYGDDYLIDNIFDNKSYGLSVRCVKN